MSDARRVLGASRSPSARISSTRARRPPQVRREFFQPLPRPPHAKRCIRPPDRIVRKLRTRVGGHECSRRVQHLEEAAERASQLARARRRPGLRRTAPPPSSSRAPKNGHGNRVARTCRRTAARESAPGAMAPAPGSTASSRSTPGMATARRGKRNAQVSSTTQTALSHPSPTRRADEASSSGNCSERSARTSVPSTSISASHSGIAAP